ncbi:MAG TPA: cation diffusion facilitator family transporter [Longimicrobium sp.]|jgi:cobalt-zinc-cadmium efflux system protein|nr:cation diffusion facilitator family transporter [Longimicrobium sp.]
MGAGQHHHHGHGHDHARAGRDHARRLAFTLVLQAAYLVAEVVGGYLANSLSLLADAGHMLSDVAALALSLFAVWIAQKPATARRTFGYYRTEILAALANAATLIAISIYIFYEAAQRLRSPEPVEGMIVVGVAVGGLLVNGIGAAALHGGREHSLNIRGAWLHLMTDAAGNVGVIAGGILVWAWGLAWADPAMSVLIGLLVIWSSWGLLKDSVAVLLEGAPPHIEVEAVRAALMEVEGVEGVHDLHVWSITSGIEALSCHVVVGSRDERRVSGEILADMHAVLRQRFGLNHLTVQIEPRGFQEQDCIALGC